MPVHDHDRPESRSGADAASATHLWLRAMCDEFSRCGMQHACTAPGSRNSPIVVSLVRESRISCWSHIDERCAGFFALGAAKASGRPVAVTCTSGTAAANLAPAVIEAFQARVPLIVLTADRPAELREVGAGQAIDQVKLYGDAVKWFFEVEAPDASIATLRWIRQLACRAYWTTLDGRPGPVHLNLPLREPLALDGPLLDEPLPGRADGAPWVRRARTVRRRDAGAGTPVAQRGVVVAGRLEHAAGGEPAGDIARAAARLSERVGWPLLADPLSGARDAANAIASYDLLLRDPALATRLAPEIIVRVGDLPTSKPLRAWLAGLPEIRQLVLDPDRTWQDPDAIVGEFDDGNPVDALDELGAVGGLGGLGESGGLGAESPPEGTWLERWRTADRVVGAALASALGDGLSEPLVAARLGDWLGPEATLMCAASMPIRDLELYLPAGRPLPRVLSNRGANGIDGTVSTAFGLAAAGRQPVVLLIGDVALVHDLGGLIAARRLELPLTIVVINNDGGGIFHFLAISDESDAFERHVATPHGLQFERAAGLYGLGYERPRTADDLGDAIQRSIAGGTATLIEVRTEREANLAFHRRLADAGLAALARLG
jgi:2-succinyl-5-enolpyruvyl-6-hydroxy-3-cyclohexene-1-carboxylate synthase